MGTAPRSDSTPAMPDPERAVSRSVTMLGHQRYNRQQALTIIYIVARRAIRDLESVGIGNTRWLRDLARIAKGQLAVPVPSHTDYQENMNGDGSSGPASGPEAGTDR